MNHTVTAIAETHPEFSKIYSACSGEVSGMLAAPEFRTLVSFCGTAGLTLSRELMLALTLYKFWQDGLIGILPSGELFDNGAGKVLVTCKDVLPKYVLATIPWHVLFRNLAKKFDRDALCDRLKGGD
jgi:hypothetical protein